MKIEKVLVVYPYSRASAQLGGFAAAALKARGLAASVFCFQPYRYSSRLGRGFLGGLEYRLEERRLFAAVAGSGADLVFVVKGDELLPATVERLRERFRVPVVNWWTDDPCLLNVSTGISPAYDAFFTNDPDSVAAHGRAGCKLPLFLTFACEPALHRQVELTAGERARYGSDLVFVGLLTPKRLEYLEALSAYDIKIWSRKVVREYVPGTGSVTQRPVPETSPVYGRITGEEAWDEELIKIYSASKVVLNIHAHGRSDPNIRVFEATGCGAFLLTEDRRLLGDFFERGRELAAFDGKEQLERLAGQYLRDTEARERIAAAGRRRAYADHTYAARMGEMLDRLAGAGL